MAAIYAAHVPLPAAGRYAVLAVTKDGRRMLGAAAEIVVRERSRIPEVGERPPPISTDTLASLGGDVEELDTRVPPSDLHEVDFADVVGERPVALLFSTPLLCQTRVCGPVTDIAVQLQHEFEDRVQFIHQEVYVDNEVEKGLRPPLRAFGLRNRTLALHVRRWRPGRGAARRLLRRRRVPPRRAGSTRRPIAR